MPAFQGGAFQFEDSAFQTTGGAMLVGIVAVDPSLQVTLTDAVGEAPRPSDDA
jgi:hypothetical protein